MPDNEKKSLTLALLLHEKGRTQLKTENYNEALILFLEADHELSICNSNLVQMIDNYAILILKTKLIKMHSNVTNFCFLLFLCNRQFFSYQLLQH